MFVAIGTTRLVRLGRWLVVERTSDPNRSKSRHQKLLRRQRSEDGIVESSALCHR